MMNASFMIVLITVVINMMGVGLAWPTLPSLVQELSGGTLSQTAYLYGITAIIFSLMQFLCAPLMGLLSDRYGRRPVMLVALTGLGLDSIFMAFAPSVYWMVFARALGGMFGATMTIANAYVADTYDKKDRAAGFGMIGAAFGIGFTLGPLTGGILGAIDIRYPFYCAAALSFTNCLFGYFFLRESLPNEKRDRNLKPFENPFKPVFWLFKNQVLLLLGLALMMVTVIQRGLESIWVIFTGHQFGWNTQQAGLSLAIVGVSYIVTQGFLVRHVIRILGETKTIVYGFLLAACMYAILAFNTNGLIGYISIVPYILGWGCAAPALQAMASRQVNAKQQGRLQGAMSSISGLSAIAGPGLSAWSFAFFTSNTAPFYFPGAFLLLGFFVLILASSLGVNAGKKMVQMNIKGKNNA